MAPAPKPHAIPLPGPHPRLAQVGPQSLPRRRPGNPPRIAPPDSWRSLRDARVPPMDYLGKPTLGPTIATPNQHLSPFLLSHDRGAVQ